MRIYEMKGISIMKHLFCFIMTCALIAQTLTLASAQQETEKFDFRQIRWGMSPTDVTTSEGKQPGETKKENIYTILYFPSTAVLEYKMTLIYQFVQDRLIAGRYALEDVYSNPNDYFKVFGAFYHLLQSKYGAPKKDNGIEGIWKNDFYKSRGSDTWGLAISLGHVDFVTLWETKTTSIGLILTGNNGSVLCMVQYETKDEALKKLKEQARQKAAGKDL